jgi:hypothetical protein
LARGSPYVVQDHKQNPLTSSNNNPHLQTLHTTISLENAKEIQFLRLTMERMNVIFPENQTRLTSWLQK